MVATHLMSLQEFLRGSEAAPAIRNTAPDIWRPGLIFIPISVSSRLCAHCSRITCTVACHGVGVGRWAAATVLRAETDEN